MNELSLIEKPAMELYAPGAIRSILDKIKEAVKQTVIDPTTDKGRKEIASLAHRVAKTKVALDEAGKKLTEDARAQIDAVNAERKIVRDELDALKEEIRRPLTEYEEREKARVAGHEARISRFIEATTQTEGMDSTALTFLIAKAEEFDTSNMEEFQSRAETEKSAALHRLGKLRDEIGAAEIKAAAIEGERIERERIEREEREARIAAEAADRARIEAEEKAARQAKEEASRVAAETRRAEEAREAERKAEADRLAAAERQVKEAQERAAREIAEAAERQKREAEAVERARLAAIEAERIADEKRAANKRHREKILAEVAKDMNELVISSCIGEDIAQAIADGKIRHAYLQF